MARRDNYSRFQIGLHWLIVVLIAAAWLLHDQMKDFEKLPLDSALPLHGVIGLTVFFLMLLRVALRLFRGAPQPPEADPPWQRQLASATHWTIYALAIFGPWAGGFAFYTRAGFAADLHETLTSLLIAAIALHVAAALYHHFGAKDDILARMIPALKRR